MAFLLKGQIPVTRNPAVIHVLASDIALFHAFVNKAEKSYLVMSLPGFFEIESWTTFLHSILSGANTPLSRGWLDVWCWVVMRIIVITPSATAALLT